MEYGLMPKIDQFADNKALEVQKIQPSNETSKVNEKSQLKQLQQEIIKQQKEVSETKSISSNPLDLKYEVTLTNTNFGFNDQSKDFFVKTVRGSAENQYPTEQMMRIKMYVMELNSSAS